MDKNYKETINVNGTEISIVSNGTEDDYISLTDIAKYKNSDSPADVVKNWMRLRNTIDFLGLWEELHNPNFKLVEFDQFRNASGENAFVLSPQKWIKATNAIGIVSKSGRYGGTLAHKDIAFEFASWISPEFKLYIIKDYQRLKQDENSKLSLGWNVKRELAKINYKIHTDAIKENLISDDLTKNQIGYTYANEADMLNFILFGKTAAQWKNENPGKPGNIRDYASYEELLVLSNLESINAVMLNEHTPQAQRMKTLKEIAANQLKKFIDNNTSERFKKLEN